MLSHVYSLQLAVINTQWPPIKGSLVLRGKFPYTVSTCKKNHIHHLLKPPQHRLKPSNHPSHLCLIVLCIVAFEPKANISHPTSSSVISRQSTSGSCKGFIDVCYCRLVVLQHNYFKICEYFHFLAKHWQQNHWFMQTLITVWNNMGVNQASSRGFVKCFTL